MNKEQLEHYKLQYKRRAVVIVIAGIIGLSGIGSLLLMGVKDNSSPGARDMVIVSLITTAITMGLIMFFSFRMQMKNLKKFEMKNVQGNKKLQ